MQNYRQKRDESIVDIILSLELELKKVTNSRIKSEEDARIKERNIRLISTRIAEERMKLLISA